MCRQSSIRHVVPGESRSEADHQGHKFHLSRFTAASVFFSIISAATNGFCKARSPYPFISGTLAFNSFSHIRALPSDGARQSPRGDSEPPDVTFGPFGDADRLNWLIVKNRKRKTSIQCLMTGRSKLRRLSAGKCGGQIPASASRQAL